MLLKRVCCAVASLTRVRNFASCNAGAFVSRMNRRPRDDASHEALISTAGFCLNEFCVFKSRRNHTYFLAIASNFSSLSAARRSAAARSDVILKNTIIRTSTEISTHCSAYCRCSRTVALYSVNGPIERIAMHTNWYA